MDWLPGERRSAAGDQLSHSARDFYRTIERVVRTPLFSPGICRAHFHSKACCRVPILTSNVPGSTMRLLLAPMKDKSSEVNSKESWRLSPGCSKTFANRLSRFKGGVALATRSFKYS